MLLLAAAGPAGFQYWSAGELKAFDQKLSNGKPVNTQRLVDYDNHYTMVAHREGNGEAEWHEHEADFLIGQTGSATLKPHAHTAEIEKRAAHDQDQGNGAQPLDRVGLSSARFPHVWGTGSPPPHGQPERWRRVRNMAAQHDAEGFGHCSNHGECEAVCPKGISLNFIAFLNSDLRTSVFRG